MSPTDALTGLSCPRCGGMVPVPEGQAIVLCPFCDQRSVVRGENGIRRYQVPMRIAQEQAEKAFKKFLSSNLAIAPAAKREAKLTESFVVHLPFWATWGRGLGWVFGKKQVGSGDHKRYEPKEVKIVQEMTWNGAACEVGEFGVTQINLEGRPLEPFAADQLHHSGMVFEPTGSAQEAQEQARQFFERSIAKKADIDRVSQTFVRIVRPRRGLVYYPLWVLRYEYRGRSFQVVVDGFSGEMLYGKAPGNLIFRAGVLVGGMAAGSFLLVDVPYLILNSSSDSSDNTFGFLIAMLAVGLVVMGFSYRRYRYGEHYEYRKRFAGLQDSDWGASMPTSLRQVTDIINKLEFFLMSPAPVELIPMLCLKCQQPVPAQPDEVVWRCQNCGQGLLLSDDRGLLPQVIHFSAGIPANAQGKPVWVVSGSVTLQRETFSGDNSRDMQQFWAQPRWFFIPAYDLTLDPLVEAGLKFLKAPLPLQESGAAAPFLAVTVHPEDLLPLAEFIIMAVEAERRDQLQSINFSLQLGQPELWIFP